jgi:hypothetical protein
MPRRGAEEHRDPFQEYVATYLHPRIRTCTFIAAAGVRRDDTQNLSMSLSQRNNRPVDNKRPSFRPGEPRGSELPSTTPAYTTLATPTRHRRNRFQVPYPTTSLPAARARLCTQWRAPGTVLRCQCSPGPTHLNVPRGASTLVDQPRHCLVG